MSNTESSTPVADALAGVDHVQNELPYDGATWRSRELAALRDLADAVRLELSRPSDAVELAAQAEHAARTMAPPVPDVTANLGYTVRAVLPGDGPCETRSASARSVEWYVAAENAAGKWVTWHAWVYVVDSGSLTYENGHTFDTTDSRRDALADLAERAGIAHTAPF